MPGIEISTVEALLRHEVCYRSAGRGAEAAMLGAGFMLKPGLRVDTLKACAAHYSAVYVLRGRGLYRDHRGREFALQPGHVFQRFPALPHTLLIEPDSAWAECFVACDAATQAALTRLGFPNLQAPVCAPGLTLRLVQRIDRLLQSLEQASGRDLPALLPTVYETLQDLCTADAAAARPDEATRLVETMCQLLGRDLDCREPVPELLRGMNAGYERLRKLFQARLGISPAAYRIRCRVDAARALLSAPDARVKEVAFQLGYPSAYAFSAQFKQVTGRSPLQFRQGHGG